MVRQLVKIILSTAILLSATLVLATPLRTTYQAKIVKPDGYPLEAANVNFRFTILDPAASCVLYVENYAAVNMTGTGGLISFTLGAGTRSYPVSATTFASVFDNSTVSFPCQSPGIYNPTATDARKIVMQFQDSSGWQTLPAMAINAVPYAMYAAKAGNTTLLNGKSDSEFVEYSSLASLSCQSNEAIKFNGVSFSCIPVGVSSSGISSVTTSGTVLTTGGTASAPVISIMAASMSNDGYLTSLDYAEFKTKLGASSTEIITTLGYAPVSGAAVTAQIDAVASAANSVNTLVRRDSSGNFTANDIFANSTKTNYVDIYKPSTSFNIRLQAPTSLSANYTLILPATSGTTGQVLSTDGTGNLSWIDSATGAVTSVSGTLNEITSTGGSTPALGLANIGTAGTYFKVITDNKGRVTSGATTLLLSDLPNTVLSTTSAFAGDISGIISNITVNRIQGVSVTVSSLTANDILQYDGSKYVNRSIPTCAGNHYITFNGSGFACVFDAGASGTVASITVTGPISSTGGSNPTLSIAQANSTDNGYLSASDWNIFNNKQAATSAAIITTLGYTPAASGSFTSSQWNTSGTTINYIAGNVGIGTASPESRLEVANGDIRIATSGKGIGLIPNSTTIPRDIIWDGSGTLIRDTGYVEFIADSNGDASGGFRFYASGTTRGLATPLVTINLSGNMGVGTSNPTRRLDVQSNAPAIAAFNTAPADHGYLEFYTHAASSTMRTGYVGYPTAGSKAFTIYSQHTSGAVQLQNIAGYLKLADTGHVGIGWSSPVTKLDVNGGLRIGMESATCAVSYAGTLRYNAGNVEFCDGTTWVAFGVSGAGLQSLNGSASGTQSFANGTTGTAPGFATLNGIHTLNIPFASVGTTTAGLISNADYANFAGKITSSAASIAQVLGYVPASATALGSYLVKANNLSDLTSNAAARTNLGLGTFATASTIDLGSASATGTLAIARTPGYTGDVTKAAASNTLVLSNSGVTAGTYTKVTVDVKGRVTSSAALASSDVTTALGYTPAASGSFTISQWTTSATSIFYNTGNVGLGVVNPSQTLDVSGTVKVNKLYAGNGAFNSPSITFASDPNTGLYNAGGYLGFSVAGALKGTWSGSSLSFNAGGAGPQIYFTGGNAAQPSYAFNVDSDTGMFNPNSSGGSNELGFSTSGTEKIRITSTGNVGIGTTAPVTKLVVSGGVKISMESAICAVSYAGTLRYNAGNVEFCDGTTWAAFGVSGEGLQSLNGSASATQSFANGTTGTAPAFVTTNGIHRLNIPLASAGSVTAGLLSNTDYTTFSNKITSSAASVAQVLGYVPASATALGNYLVKANNLSDLASSVAARTNLGLGTFATASTIDLGSASATGTLAIARTPAYIGDVTKAAASNTLVLSNSGVTAGTYTKVTVNAKGRVTSSAALAAGDVTTALGYTPAASGSFTSSQWNTSGTSINYITGDVGVGTAAPSEKLHVAGNIFANMGEGFRLLGDSNYFGSNLDAIVLEMQDGNSTSGATDGGFVFRGHTTTDSLDKEWMVIRSPGNVGIGTSAPATRLHVLESTTMGSVGSLNLNNAVMRVQEASGTSLNFDGNTIAAEADLFLGTKNLNNFHLFANDTTRLFIAGSSGNIGIGTTAPAAQLDISAGTSGGAVRLGYSGPTYGAYIDTSNTYSGSWAREFSLGYGGSKLGSFGALATSSTLSYLYLNADQNGVNSGHVNPSMVITPAGYVGVSTSSPANILSVGADLGAMANPLSSITLGSANANTLFTLGQDATNRGRIKWTYNATPANAFMSIGSNVSQALVLQDAGGNVGIGKTSPQQKLDVNGEVVAALGTYANFRAIGGNYAAMIRNDGVNTYMPLLTASGNQYGTWNTLRPMSVNNASGDVYLADGKVYVEHSTGEVGIGLTNPGAILHAHSSGTPLKLSNPTASWSVGPEGGTGSFIIYNGSGTGQWMSNGGTSWAANSDRRLKKHIRPIESALEKALQLNGMTYLYNTDSESAPRRVGVIAQDVEKVLPEAIERKSNGMLGVKYVEIIPLLINALKEFYSVWFHDSHEIHSEIAKIKAENAQLRNIAEDASSRAIKAESQAAELKSALCELHPKSKVCVKVK